MVFFFYCYSSFFNNQINNRCEAIEGLKNEAILELKSYCVSGCTDKCKEIIEKYQEMECFEELKGSIGELFTNSQKSCCESNQIICESSSNLSGGAIAGIVIGSIIGGLLIIGLIIFIVMKNKLKNNQPKKLGTDFQVQLQSISKWCIQ